MGRNWLPVLCARSARKNRPFVAVNCSAVPEALLESELRARAQQTALAATNGIDAIQVAMEKIVLGTVSALAAEVPGEADLYRMVRTTVALNPEVVGACIALAPQPDGRGGARYLAPYACRADGGIATKDLGQGDYDYER